MSERNRARADRIREEIDISQVLSDYGYYVHMGAEHQFSCDLHGDGQDNKPSARVYPESASWYCWACEKSRDAIETVRAKEGIGFFEAIQWLEKRFGLPALPWDDERDAYVPTVNPFDETYKRAKSFDEERAETENMLNSWMVDRDLPVDALLGFWEAFDMIEYQMRKGGWDEHIGSAAMMKLRNKAMEQAKEINRAG